jgi:uncharacterized membrane protein YoaK (UPF0700 family)
MSSSAASPNAVAGPAAAHLHHPLARALIALTFTTGLVDAVSYLGLGHVFTANMTGNVVLLGFGLAGGTGLPVLAPIVSLVSFLAGAFVGGRIQARFGAVRPYHLIVPLAFEAFLVAGALVYAVGVSPHPGTVASGIVIALLAGAMGVRNAAVRSLAVPDLTTTVLTLTLTGLASDLGKAGALRSAPRRGTAVISMLAGALVGALLLKTGLWLSLSVALAAVVATAAGYARATGFDQNDDAEDLERRGTATPRA